MLELQVIPSDFARYHRTLHLEDITLEGPCGRSWAVTIRQDKVMHFGKGWRQFSVENHLREGYQLLFHLLGEPRFVVRFFDNLGKSLANFPPLTPMPAFVEPRSASRREEEANLSEVISKRKRGYVTDEERQTPLTAATRIAAGLNNESFLVVLKDYQIYHGFQLVLSELVHLFFSKKRFLVSRVYKFP